MSVRRIASSAVVSALVSEQRVAPREIQLWNNGENPTDYGVHVWTERSRAEVLARYTERGNPLLVDVEHNGSTVAGEPAVTGGYARLELRAGAPWLVFDWSDYGRGQIESGQRRFLSPEYDVDKNTGEILALYRVSLVADPGTHRARMLATAGRGKMDQKVLLAALRAALSAEDPAVTKESIANLVAELEKGDGGEGSATDDTATDTTQADASTEDSGEQQTAAEDDEDAKKKADEAEKARAKAAAKAKPAPAGSVDAIAAAATAATAQIKAAQRDHLLATQGDKLEPAIRRWASAQPLEVVESYLASIPSTDAPAKRAKATRGDGATNGLSERELQKCKSRGVDPAKFTATKSRMGF